MSNATNHLYNPLVPIVPVHSSKQEPDAVVTAIGSVSVRLHYINS